MGLLNESQSQLPRGAEIVPVSRRDSLHIYRARDELLATLLFVLNKINREIRQSAVSAISFWP